MSGIFLSSVRKLESVKPKTTTTHLVLVWQQTLGSEGKAKHTPLFMWAVQALWCWKMDGGEAIAFLFLPHSRNYDLNIPLCLEFCMFAWLQGSLCSLPSSHEALGVYFSWNSIYQLHGSKKSQLGPLFQFTIHSSHFSQKQDGFLKAKVYFILMKDST